MQIFSFVDFLSERDPDAGYLIFTIVALLVLFILMVLAESLIMQLMNWGALKPSLKAATVMNLISSLASFIVLAMVPRIGTPGIFVAFLISVIIEALVLIRFKSGKPIHNWSVSLAANLGSYLILIYPAFLKTMS